MEKLAIDAVYVDYRRVKGRKCHQIVFEVPSEKWPEVYRVLGEPTIDSSEWFAIAKMAGVKPQEAKGGKLAQRAGILCNEAAFQRFVGELLDAPMAGTESAVRFIYNRCGVMSRAHLDHDDDAARAFHDLDIEYRNWLNGISPDTGSSNAGSSSGRPLSAAKPLAGASPVSASASNMEKA